MIPQSLYPQYIGKSPEFIRKAGELGRALPSIFERISWCRLRAAYDGVKALRIVEELEQGMSFCYYNPQTDVVSIYPMAWRQGDRLDLAVYTGFGWRHWYKNISTARKAQWVAKEFYPSHRIREKVMTIFDNNHSFIETMKRLVGDAEAWVFCNTIIDLMTRRGLKDKDLVGSRYDRYPLIADVINGYKPISYEPLAIRYGGGRLDVRVYHECFASYCASNGSVPLANNSASEAYGKLFQVVSNIGPSQT